MRQATGFSISDTSSFNSNPRKSFDSMVLPLRNNANRGIHNKGTISECRYYNITSADIQYIILGPTLMTTVLMTTICAFGGLRYHTPTLVKWLEVLKDLIRYLSQSGIFPRVERPSFISIQNSSFLAKARNNLVPFGTQGSTKINT